MKQIEKETRHRLYVFIKKKKKNENKKTKTKKKKTRHPLRGRSILLITPMITDRNVLHSILLSL